MFCSTAALLTLVGSVCSLFETQREAVATLNYRKEDEHILLPLWHVVEEAFSTPGEGSDLVWRAQIVHQKDNSILVARVKTGKDHMQCILPESHGDIKVEKQLQVAVWTTAEEIEAFVASVMERPAPSRKASNLYWPPETGGHCDVVEGTITEKAFIDTYVLKSRPVVIKKAAVEWPSMSWSLESLTAHLGVHALHVKISPGGVFEGPESLSLWTNSTLPPYVLSRLESPDRVIARPATAMMTVSQLVDELSKVDPERAAFYLEYTNLAGLKKLAADVTIPSFARKLILEQKNIWLGGATKGKLHFDPFENLMTVIKGAKNFTLMHPHLNERLYEGHVREGFLRYENGVFHRDRLPDSTSMVMSPVHIDDPSELVRYPYFMAANRSRLHCPVAPGDVLYVPSFWWHEVDSAGPYTLATNMWFKPMLTKQFPCKTCKLYHNAVDYP
eukprot:TRINITY_DN10368_c0_g1_i1.p1 TRINITY_DN10368_c0_g1~~TRINITY_DN10368_c0_g1_i1.p1  ORF type:complete len:445 (+),score=90.60 TRINITY_DN10368_c0_g1_i1:86-1420(+)